MNKETAIKKIQEGDIKGAIQAMKELSLSLKEKQSLSIIEATYSTLSQEILKGTIDSEEQQLRFNRINDKLLTILLKKDILVRERNTRRKALLLTGFIGIGLLFCLFYVLNARNVNCPNFDGISKNKILLIPFENVGNEAAQPHVLLRDRIEELSIKKKLSTDIQLGEAIEGMTMREAPKIALSCDANVIIWGKYSKSTDSLRLILQYQFLEQPQWSKMSDLMVLRDVTSIQQGSTFKDLEDTIMLLCSIIAVRQDKLALTKKWLAKIKDKEQIALIDLLKDIPDR